MEVKSVLTASVTGTLPPKDGKNPEAYKITVVYSDGSKTVLRKTYPDFVDLQVIVYTLLKEKGGYSRKTSRTLVSSLPELNSPLSRMLYKDSDLKKMERMDAFIKELLTLPTVVRESENVRTFFGVFMEQQETSERSENEEQLKNANKVAEMLSGRDPLRSVPEHSPVPSRKKSEYSDASWVPEDLHLLSGESRENILRKLNERRPSKNIPPLPGKIRTASTDEEVMEKRSGSSRPGLRRRPFSVAQAAGIADMLKENEEFIKNTSGSESSQSTVAPPSSSLQMDTQQVSKNIPPLPGKIRMAYTDEDVMEKESRSPRPGLRRRPFSVAQAVNVADMFKENEKFNTNTSVSERSQSTVVPPISSLEMDEQQSRSNDSSPRFENSVDAECNEYNKEQSRARKISTQNGRKSPNRIRYVAISSFVAEETGEVSLEDGEEVDVVQKESSGWWYVKNEFGEGWAPSAYLAPAQVSRTTSPETLSQSQDVDSREQSSPIEQKLDAVPKGLSEKEEERGFYAQEKQKSLARSGGKESQKISTEMNRRVRFLTVEGIQKRKNPDKNYVYILKVVWSDGAINIIYRQCSDFFFLQESLRKEFPTAIGKEIPVLKGRKFTENCHFCFKDGTCKRRQFMNQFCHELINAPDNISKCQAVMVFCKPRSSDLLPHGQSEKNGGKTKETGDDDNVHISGPVVFEQYIVIADYKKKNTNDISLTAGETVDVIERNDLGWWLVDRDGELGWAPASHLEPTDDGSEITTSKKFAPGKEEVYQSVQSYQAKAEDELSFDAGLMLRVVEKTLDGWWLVRYQGKEGWAPAMFLRKVASDDSSCSSSGRMDELEIVSFNGDSENSDGKRLTRTPPTRRSMVQRSVRRKPKRNSNPDCNGKPTPEEQEPSASEKKKARAISVPARAATPPVTKRMSPRAKLLSSPARPRSSEFTQTDVDKQWLNRELSLSSGYGTSPSGSLSSLASDVFPAEENTSPIKKCATLPRFDHIDDSEVTAPSPIPRSNSLTTMAQYKKEQESAVKDGKKSPIPAPRKISATNRKSPLAGSPPRIHDLKMSLSQSGSDMECESGSDYRNDSESPRQKVSREVPFYRRRQNEKASSLYRAMYTYIAQEEGEVNFNEGDVVEVIERSSNGWYLLNTQHGLGWGPSNFLQSEAY